MSLVLKNVSKVFEDSKEDVLNEINLEIEKGERMRKEHFAEPYSWFGKTDGR